ncbi:hypothetical protein GCM10022247_37520 [Allokutzneria multivorans]|uniref:Uncharacterized protein n=1 Tax=Allokutzneria multivorans TaxID=1142134 RepID=A0ABP7SGU8_9PSEU
MSVKIYDPHSVAGDVEAELSVLTWAEGEVSPSAQLTLATFLRSYFPQCCDLAAF